MILETKKDLGRHISRDALTKLVDVLAMEEFHDLRRDLADEYIVTPARLGVYRPSEHIDNPKNLSPDPADPKSVDSDFEPWVLAGDPLLQVDPQTSMKRYIVRSRAFMVSELERAIAAGPTPDGYRYFGSALHVLEDFFAHSNFVELSLRKVGHMQVLPWTSAVECRHGLPLVTGMFGSTDVIASLAEPIAKALFPVDGWEFKPSKPGDRTSADRIMLILLSEHSDPEYLAQFQQFLHYRDAWASKPGHELLERVGWIASAPLRLALNSHNLVYSALLQLLGNSVDDVQTLTEGDPNTNGSTDPSHSQLGKDHDVHPFHTLAARLAKAAVLAVGKQMYARWQGDVTADPARMATYFFAHPNDCKWQDQPVSDWAIANPAKVRRGASATELQHMHEEHGKDALERVRRLGRYGVDGWEYIRTNYDKLFNSPNQLTK